MKYKYLVSYHCQSGERRGFGDITFTADKKIKHEKHIEELMNFIKKETGFESIIILNYKLIRRFWRE